MEHLELIKPQALQLSGHKELLNLKRSGEDMTALVKDSFTGFCGGDPIGCAGFIEQWPGRAAVWAILDGRVTPNIFILVHRHVVRAIGAYQPYVFHRLEMTVMEGFSAAHRWARMLGFHSEGIMCQYDQWKRNHTLYARISHGD